MDEMKYQKIGEANSRAEAEVIESFLQAEGIDVELVEESVSHSTFVVPHALVQIFVPKEQAEQCSQREQGTRNSADAAGPLRSARRSCPAG